MPHTVRLVFGALLAYQRRASLHRTQLWVILLALVPPTALFAFETSSRTSLALLGVAPLGVAAAALLLGWVLRQHRMLDLVLVAREAIFVAMADPAITLDEAGHVLDLNPAAEQALGWSANTAVGAEIQALLPQQFADLQTHGPPHWRTGGLIMLNLDHDGETHHYDVRLSPFGLRPGHVNGHLLVLRDITTLKQTELRLAEQASQLEAIFEAQADPVVVYDQQRRLVRGNRAWEDFVHRHADMLGLNTDPAFAALPLADQVDRLNQQVWDEHGCVIPAEDLPASRALMGETMTGSSAVDERVQRPDGFDLQLSVSAAPVRNGEGHIIGAVVVGRDATAHRQLERQLAESEGRFSKAFQASPAAMTITSRRTPRIVAANRAASLITGYCHEELIGRTVPELGTLEPSELQGLRERLLADKQIHDVPIGVRTKSGEIRSCLASTESIWLDDEECLITILHDITERIRSEEALRIATAAALVAQQEEQRRRLEAERREEIAESLRVVLSILNSNRSQDEVLGHIVRQVERLLGSEAAAIYGVDSASEALPTPPLAETLTRQAAHGLRYGHPRRRGFERLPFAHAAVERALASQRPVAVLDACVMSATATGGDRGHRTACIPHLNGVLPEPYHALLVVPIRVQNGIYGCLLLFYTQPCHFTGEEVALAQAYADQAAQAITNARLQAHIAQEAAAAERNRLARELHDTVTQEIFSASLLAETLPKVWEHWPRAETEQALEHLHGMNSSALAGLRALLLELRPAALEQLSLAQALRQLGAAMSARAGLPIAVTHQSSGILEGAEPPLPAAVKVAFYRVAQEALMNAAKYAQARAIHVRLRTKGHSRTELEIADDGRGFDPGAIPAGHFGLAMMRERAHGLGADLQVRSTPGQGTRVIVAWQSSRRAAAAAQKGADRE
jgi:PAS domain S-box-containing protein